MRKRVRKGGRRREAPEGIAGPLTHVVVARDRHGGAGARPLLLEVVAEAQDAGVVLQHGGDLHLHRVSQLLPLWGGQSGVRRLAARRRLAAHLVVDLQLHQRGVARHGFDDGLHAVSGDEVGLDVEALQAGVLLEHLSTRLRHTHTHVCVMMSPPGAQPAAAAAHVGHGVVAPGGGDAQNLHVGVALHGFKDVLQRGDGNVLRRDRWGTDRGQRSAAAPAQGCVLRRATFDLDVVEVDLRQAAVVAQDPLQRLLHVGAVGRLSREDLEGVTFDHTCRRRQTVKKAPPLSGGGGGGLRTVDALRVGDGPSGAQSVVVLLVAHQRVHPQDG